MSQIHATSSISSAFQALQTATQSSPLFQGSGMGSLAPSTHRGVDGVGTSDELAEEQQGPTEEEQRAQLEAKVRYLDQMIQAESHRMQTMESSDEEGGQDLRSKGSQRKLDELNDERQDVQMQLSQLGGGSQGGSASVGKDLGGKSGQVGDMIGKMLSL